MKAMILAAGRGERMRPLTEHCPKPLLTVNGSTLLERHIAALVTAGVSDIVINVSYLADQIIDFCDDGSRWGCSIEYSIENELLETAGGVIQALPMLGADPFFLVSADVLTDFDYRELAPHQLGSDWASLVLVPNPEHHPKGDFGLSAGRILQPAVQMDSFTYSGVGLVSSELFHSLEAGKRRIRPVFDRALESNRLQGRLWAGAWSDVGTPERLELAALQERHETHPS
ncbi:MAG: nucleotidyltransferase family protein [Luminiphilus sp.]|nr:nucleotidyltransferase family protein [Luminiphilus sp.]